nr:peptidase C48, SUMO/sentrin/Ubl1 [Tanacetum cinerariifolium]
MEASTSTSGNESTKNVKKEYTKSDIESSWTANGEKETGKRRPKRELYEMLEENIHIILIEKSKIEEKINENLIKFQDDEKLLQLKQRMREIVKEPKIPEYLSSSSSESDDDKDDGSQLANENEERYRKEKHSNHEDDVEIVTENDQTDDVVWESILENEEEIIRKGHEFSAEQRKKAQQQERERKRRKKKEKDQIGSSSQDSPVFDIDNSLLGLKSKYVNKTVDPTIELTKDEKLLGRIIFSTQEEEEEEVFNDDECTILFRMNIQSLAPGLKIDTSVIGAYVSTLNCEEKFKMTNMKHHFSYTSMMVPRILEDKTK